VAEKKKDEPKNPQEVIDEFLEEALGTLKLLDLEELIIALTALNMKVKVFSSIDLVRAFTHVIDAGSPETTPVLSAWMERYKQHISEDPSLDPKNVDEGIKFYKQDFTSAVNLGRNR